MVFNVTLISSTGATLGAVTNAQVEIVSANFNSGHVEFTGGTYGNSGQSISYGTNENSGPLQVTVARLGGTVGLLTVNLSTTDGSAKSGVNYTGS